MGQLEDGLWSWQLNWRRSFFVWENDLLNDLLHILNTSIISDNEDVWTYRLDSGGLYSVTVNYVFLSRKFASPQSSTLNPNFARVVEGVWKSWAPSKVVVFSWQALLCCLRTRNNLAKRGVILSGGQVNCPWYLEARETEDHLFLLCSFAWKIWMEVYKWFGLVEVLPNTIGALFLGFFETFRVCLVQLRRRGGEGR
ncbi:hypothetical protein QL285_042035 [Trifolium repens]|nr:hypothetical protein QL285_042035 [Trifolium repens]